MMDHAHRQTIETTLGRLTITSDSTAVTSVYRANAAEKPEESNPDPLTQAAASQLIEYLAGQRKDFDLPLNPRGTDFQKSVWRALMSIPFGETRSYKQVAQMVGNDKAARAVGLANNKNPIMIVVPCHRVVGANGSLVGYAGGLDMKRALLELERQGLSH